MQNIVTEIFEDTIPKGKGESSGVYIIEHLKTDKFYIGHSKALGARKRQHLATLRHNKNMNPNLQEVYNEDPNLRFTFVVTPTKEEALEYEQRLLNHHRNDPKLMNVELDARSSKGVVRSAETRARISEIQKGRPSPRKGIPMSEEQRVKIIESRKKLYKSVNIEGVIYPSLSEAARQLNLTIGCLGARLNRQTDRFKNWNYE